MKKRLSVTIGIPAYNEEHTIRAVLESVAKQDTRSYDLRSVIVINDNSTDHTGQVIKDFRAAFPSLLYVKNKKRLGKSRTLTKLFQKNKSDVFLALDADIVLGDTYFISHLVEPFRNADIGLVAACDVPQNPKTFVEKIIVTGVTLWDEIRHTIENGRSIHNVHGTGYALSKAVAKNLDIPENNLNDDQYIYLRVKQLGYAFQHVCAAMLYYYVPGTAADYLAQSARFMKGAEIIVDNFGSYATFEFAYPSYVRIPVMAKYLIKHPFYLPLAMLFQIFIRLFKSYFETDFSKGHWKQIVSTKKVRKIRENIFKRLPLWNLFLSVVQIQQHHTLKHLADIFSLSHKLTFLK